MNAIVEHAPSTQPTLTPSHGGALTPMEMLNHAVERGATVEVLEKLLTLQERWEKNLARKAFDAAIANAKAEITPVVRNSEGHNSKKYADFAAIARAVDPIISKHGLSYRFRSTQAEKINVTCILSHKDGHCEETTLSGPADASGSKNAIQAIGSTLTYLQRYSLVQALGLAASNDDDGKAAGGASESDETITQEQADAMKQLIVSRGANLAAFLKWAKVQKVEEIKAVYHDSCVAAIKGAAK